MSFGDKVALAAKEAEMVGFEPPVRPACAAFASTMLRRAGWRHDLVTYVPHLMPLGAKVQVPAAGDLVIFDRTYDAVAPSGVGPEDDMTHVGVMLNSQDLVHYSASADRPVRSNLAAWSGKINCFLRFSGPEEQKPAHWAQKFYTWLKAAVPLETDHGLDTFVTWGELSKVLYQLPGGKPGALPNMKGGNSKMSDKMTALDILHVGATAVKAAETAGGTGPEKKAFAISTIWNMIPTVMQDKELWSHVVELIVAIGNMMAKFDIFKVGGIVTMLLHIYEHWKKLNPAV